MNKERLEPRERYPGERQGFGLFLEELQPVVAEVLGTDSLLHHAIRKALASGRLSALRHARGLFNSLPRAERQTLQSGMLALHEPPARTPQEADPQAERRPSAVVRLDCSVVEGGPWSGRTTPRTTLGHEVLDDVALRVLVRPGSLPSSVADRLREIADLLERDRRLLSSRHWQGDQGWPDGRGEAGTDPEAGGGPGSAESG